MVSELHVMLDGTPIKRAIQDYIRREILVLVRQQQAQHEGYDTQLDAGYHAGAHHALGELIEALESLVPCES